MPEKIAHAPELFSGLELYFTAFMELTTCRSSGFGVGPIFWSSINDYCLVNEMEGEQREDVFYYLRQMDQAYLDWQSKQVKKDG